MNEIDVLDLAARLRSGAPLRLLDVREADELATASISGAMHIPLNAIPARLDELPRDTPIVVFCHHGGRSARVTRYLEENGFTNVANLRGGVDAWSLDVDPTLPRY